MYISLTPLAMNQPEQRTFCFELVETTTRDIAVKASSHQAALAQVREHYARGHWIGCPRRGEAHALDEHGNRLGLAIF